MEQERYILGESNDGQWVVTHHAPTDDPVIHVQINALAAFDSAEEAISYVRSHAMATQKDINTLAYEDRSPTDTEIEIPVVKRS